MNQELYIALRRFRTELWRSVPPFVTVRWLFNRHPQAVIPVSLLLFAVVMFVVVGDWATS